MIIVNIIMITINTRNACIGNHSWGTANISSVTAYFSVGNLLQSGGHVA